MNDQHDLDRDLDTLIQRLPEALRAGWVVIPRSVLRQASMVGLVLGSAATLMVVGFALDISGLKWVWPLVVAGLMLATRLWPWWRGDRAMDQLRRSRAKEDA